MISSKEEIIITKFQGKDTIWVLEKYICRIIGGNISYYLWKRCRPSYLKSVPSSHRKDSILPTTGKSWRFARINDKFYYDYDYIPDRKDTQYRSRLGDRDTLIQQAYEISLESKASTQKEIAQKIEAYVIYRINNDNIRIFMSHRVNGACKFNQQKARQLTEALTWAKCIKLLIKTGEYTQFNIQTKTEFYDICASVLFKKKLEGMKVTTGESLRKKLHYFPENEDAQFEFFVSERYSNDNARKLGKEKFVDTETGEIFTLDIHQALILDLWMNPGNSDKGSKRELYEEYEEDIKELGIKPLSESTFNHYTNSYEVSFNTAKERHGAAYFRKMFQPYITGKKPVYANSLWCADGSGTIAYRYINAKGKLNSMRLYVIMITDVATGKIVGWYPAEEGTHDETPKMVREAMLHALRENGKHQVMEFVSDNHGAFTSKESREFLELICRHVRTIEPGNSQANYAETQFRLFKKRLRRMSNWLGTSWDSTNIENTANEDYLDVKKFPTYQEVILQLAEKINEWNNNPNVTGTSRSELYESNLHPEVEILDSQHWRRLSGNCSKKEITRQRGIIVLEKKGTKYKFEVPGYEVMGELVQEYLGYTNIVPTLIYWDEECADVYTQDGRYMFSCNPALESSQTHAEANTASIEAISKGMAKKARTTNAVDSFKENVERVKSYLCTDDEEVTEPYNIARLQGKNVKELVNGAREAVASKRIQKKQSKKQSVYENPEAWEDYMQKRERLYKPQNS